MNNPISEAVMALKNRKEPITLSEYKCLFLNSWEKEYLIDRCDLETLEYLVDVHLNNCSIEKPAHSQPAPHYDSAVAYRLLPEAMRRLRPQVRVGGTPRDLELILFIRGCMFECTVYLKSVGPWQYGVNGDIRGNFKVLKPVSPGGLFKVGEVYSLAIGPCSVTNEKTGQSYEVFHREERYV